MGIETYEQKRLLQLSLLSKQLVSDYFGKHTGGRIKVYTFEANIGKTETLIKTLESMITEEPSTRSMVVCKLKTEVDRIAFRIPNAVAIHSDNDKVDENELIKYNVIVTTQAKYLMLCKNHKLREKFFNGRQNLIFDEELSILQMDILNSLSITRMETILKEISVFNHIFDQDTKADLGSVYKHIIAGIETEKNKYINNQMKFFNYIDEQAEEKISNLVSLVEKAKFAINYLKHLRIKHNITTDKQSVIGSLEMLKRYFNNSKVIVSSKALYTFNDRMQFHLLQNNIMLDASSKFHHLYKICDIFDVIDSERIFDHSNWKIHFINQNSTAYSKHHNDEYYIDVMKLIKNTVTEEDKVFLLGSAEDLKIIDIENSKGFEKFTINPSNFHAMRGKNTWEEYNKCFIIHNPSISFFAV